LLEIEFDQHGGLIADHPPLVSRFNGDELWSFELEDAAVGKADVDLAARHEADVRVHAQFRADNGLQVGSPVEPRRIDHAFHARRAGAEDIDLDTANLTVLVSLHGR
jgi:hypothetical protein